MNNYGWITFNNKWKLCEILRYNTTDEIVINLNNKEIIIDLKNIFIANNNSETEINELNNLINLQHLHEPAILYHTITRYNNDNIYTFTGDILLSVNPFKNLNLYDNNIIKQYHTDNLDSLNPHIFTISERAYNSSFPPSPSSWIDNNTGTTEGNINIRVGI